MSSTRQDKRKDAIRAGVRENYGKIAQSETTSCGCLPSPMSSSCCGTDDTVMVKKATAISTGLGYSNQEVNSAPEGANMGLGCGNPQAIASLKEGETVLDLGSGGGFDSFLAARAVKSTGYVIGVDMTPEMISKARSNAENGEFKNVDFRLGEIENLPVADNSVDVIISNCVINLSPEKPKVFKEAYRVLRSKGRLAVSDIVATAELPEDVKNDFALYAGCMAGASLVGELENMLKKAGFTNIRINLRDESKKNIQEWFPGRKFENFVISANIEAIKP